MLATQFADAVTSHLSPEAGQAMVDLLTTLRQAVNDDPEGAHRCLDRVTSMLRPLVAVEEPGAGEYALGGLAPWQLRLVCNYVDQHLSDRILIEDLAVIAQLSVSHFTRAFKASIGCPPHRFILQKRIERAKKQ